jgi:hypothetical protein
MSDHTENPWDKQRAWIREQNSRMDADADREALGYLLAGHFSGNSQPDMSGDPRKRLSPLRRRDMDDAINEIIHAGFRRVKP